SMSVIRAAQVAAEAAAGLSEDAEDAPVVEATAEEVREVKPQYVFTITDGGFAKRTRISEYRLTNRGGLGVRAMALANEDRGGLVGAFIVEEGDEVLSITQAGQVVRSPINDQFRPTGRSTMGVRFVTPKEGDAVAVVARSVEAREEEQTVEESSDAGSDATIEATDDPADDPVDPETDREE
ncbi:MAG TPA: DNA gyrase C-terminal beta-propeller domain-containing protein, partial [Nocardioidaceae bacterium]